MISKTQRQKTLERQIKRIQNKLDRLKAASNHFSRIRLFTFFAGAGLGIALYYLASTWLGWSVLGLAFLIFNVEVFLHRKVESAIFRYAIWQQIKQTQLARLTLDWQQIHVPRIGSPSKDHPFAIDLDLTGESSLHQLLDTAISEEGSRLLQEWLLNPQPQKEVILKRQRLVKELLPMIRFREKLLVNFSLVSREQLAGEKLLDYVQKKHLSNSVNKTLLISAVLAVITAVLVFLKVTFQIPSFWLSSFVAYGIIYFMNAGQLDSLLDDSVFLSEELKKLNVIFKFLETYSFCQKDALQNLCKMFNDPRNRPSRQLRRVSLLNWAVGLRMNPLVRLILNAPFPWDFFVAKQMDKLKSDLANHLPQWLEIFFELEALISLANFAFLNPNTTFPNISDSESETVFETKNMGHPLIPEAQKKRNHFSVATVGSISLITGSNMSGKSTFLKTVGTNLSLAFAGGAVDATSFNTRLFRMFTCIHINDSITDGFSFFYREVRRLKSLLDALTTETELPLFFLIDEIFKGTNNRERLIGSRSYIQALAKLPGLGLISTHDLELTHLAENIPQLHNYHFREDIKNGKMIFDYQMRPGPCPTTNALKIMEMEGLPIDDRL